MIEERYEIIKILGKGRTGGVYEAKDTVLGRNVALRRFFVQDKDINSKDYKEEFEKVTQSLSGIQHPNVLRIFDAGVDDDGGYVISQLLDGVTLKDQVLEFSYSPKDTYDLAQQLLDALSTVHDHKFMHGAINPGAIFVSKRGRGGFLYTLLDLGLPLLAPLIKDEDSEQISMADSAIIAPELIGEGKLTEKADLYMLGNILYMSLVGGHPFGGVSAEEAERLHFSGLPPLNQYRDDVPEDFIQWIEKLTAYAPESRPESAVAALKELQKIEVTGNKQSTTLAANSTPVTPASNTPVFRAANPSAPPVRPTRKSVVDTSPQATPSKPPTTTAIVQIPRHTTTLVSTPRVTTTLVSAARNTTAHVTSSTPAPSGVNFSQAARGLKVNTKSSSGSGVIVALTVISIIFFIIVILAII